MTRKRLSSTTNSARRVKVGAAISAAALLMAGCGGDDEPSTEVSGLDGAELTVGSKDFTEQLILGQIAIIALEESGASVTEQTNLAGTDVVRAALEEGEIDLYWEYTGTGWLNILQEDSPIPDAQEQYEAVAEKDLADNGIKWLEPGVFNNTYAVAANQEAAQEFGLETLDDIATFLQEQPDEANFCVAEEFLGRPDGLPGLEEAYGFEFPQDKLVTLDEGLIYEQLAKGDDCNLGEVFATDGRIAANNFVVLEDTKEFFPVYNPAMTMREETFEEHEELADLFNPIIQALDDETMAELNARVDAEGEFEEDVARDWLESEGFIG